MGLALASTLSGFVSFTLLVRAFGSDKFLKLLKSRKLALWFLVLTIGAASMWGIHLLVLRWLGV